MDRQKVLNRVFKHMTTQGKRSVILENGAPPFFAANAVSAYRGSRDQSCAIGCLIPFKIYSIDMEGKPVRRLLDEHPVVREHLRVDSERDVELLEALQNVHDMVPPSQWPRNLAFVANKFHLQCDVPIWNELDPNNDFKPTRREK